jgi:hypothetical protein
MPPFGALLTDDTRSIIYVLNMGHRWQHRSQICFKTFTQLKITKLLKTEQLLKLQKKNRIGIVRILQIFKCRFRQNKN